MPVDIPTAEVLAGSGIKTFESAAALFEKAGGEGSSSEATSPLVPVGPGLPALPKKVILKIEGNDYIDFNELPPVKGKGRSVNQSLEGQFIIVQAADLMQSRKTIPDLATWSQCFALFTAVVAKKRPDRVPELMAYMSIITKASQKYKWPSWVIYDQNFRLDAAGSASQPWSRVDPSLYAQCFTGQSFCSENWCSSCQSLDHPSQRCPLRAPKRSWTNAFSPKADTAPSTICKKYNRYNGDCKFGKQCRYTHECSRCGEAHPVSKCTKPEGTK